MILIGYISLFIASLLSLICLSGLGQILTKEHEKNFFNNIFYGFILLALFVTVVHFFFKINIYLGIFSFLTGAIIHLKKKGYYSFISRQELMTYSLILFFLIPIYISQKFHEDFGYYHLPQIINNISEKIIFGLGNVNDGFVHNSIWLNLMSIFYYEDNYNFVNIPAFLLYLTFIIYSLNHIIFKESNFASKYFLIICVFYFLLKFTRISEFGNDIPALIFSILAIFNYLKYEEEKTNTQKKIFFFHNVSFTIFAVLIKFSVIPICILTVHIFFRDYKNLYKNIFQLRFLIIFTLIVAFFLQQFIYTGCLIFPSKITCLDVSWFNKEFLTLSNKLELINKSYSEAKSVFSEEEYLQDYNWVSYWFNRNYLELTENLITITIPPIIFLILLKKKNSFKNKITFSKIFTLFLFIGFYFWITFSPVYRFAIIYFLCLIFLFSKNFYYSRYFSKKNFIILFCIFLIFNFTKNIKRIYEENVIFYGIKRIQNDYKEYKFSKKMPLQVFKPDLIKNSQKGNGWQGRLCWDIKFLCSYNKININLVNNYFIINRVEDDK